MAINIKHTEIKIDKMVSFNLIESFLSTGNTLINLKLYIMP